MADHKDEAKILITVDGSHTSVQVEGCSGGLVKAFRGILGAIEKDADLQKLFKIALESKTDPEKEDEDAPNVVAIDGKHAIELLEGLLGALKEKKAKQN